MTSLVNALSSSVAGVGTALVALVGLWLRRRMRKQCANIETAIETVDEEDRETGV